MSEADLFKETDARLTFCGFPDSHNLKNGKSATTVVSGYGYNCLRRVALKMNRKCSISAAPPDLMVGVLIANHQSSQFAELLLDKWKQITELINKKS